VRLLPDGPVSVTGLLPQIELFVDNILNTAYRDYLNRQRYFTDDLGRNFRIQLKLNY